MTRIHRHALIATLLPSLILVPSCATDEHDVLDDYASIRVTDTAGDVHEVFGSRAELIDPVTAPVPWYLEVDGNVTTDAADLLDGEYGQLIIADRNKAEIFREGNSLMLLIGDESPIVTFTWNLEARSVLFTVGEERYNVVVDGITTDDEMARFAGNLIVRFWSGDGLEHIPAIEKPQALITGILVFIILLEAGMIAGQIVNYATMSECNAQQPTRCQNEAATACGDAGFQWACAGASCHCGFLCSIGLGSVEASCSIACGNTQGECSNNLNDMLGITTAP